LSWLIEYGPGLGWALVVILSGGTAKEFAKKYLGDWSSAVDKATVIFAVGSGVLVVTAITGLDKRVSFDWWLVLAAVAGAALLWSAMERNADIVSPEWVGLRWGIAALGPFALTRWMENVFMIDPWGNGGDPTFILAIVGVVITVKAAISLIKWKKRVLITWRCGHQLRVPVKESHEYTGIYCPKCWTHSSVRSTELSEKVDFREH
jgi:hypothetical protein